MRVAKKEILDRAAVDAILRDSAVGRLATNGNDGYPMIKPLNYVYCNGSLYFHSALEGEKMESIVHDNRVCFEVDIPVKYVESNREPCSASYRYRSVIVKGNASIVEDVDMKVSALTALMDKYQPTGGYGSFRKEKLDITAVVKIDIVEIKGKEDLR